LLLNVSTRFRRDFLRTPIATQQHFHVSKSPPFHKTLPSTKTTAPLWLSTSSLEVAVLVGASGLPRDFLRHTNWGLATHALPNNFDDFDNSDTMSNRVFAFALVVSHFSYVFLPYPNPQRIRHTSSCHEHSLCIPSFSTKPLLAQTRSFHLFPFVTISFFIGLHFDYWIICDSYSLL